MKRIVYLLSFLPFIANAQVKISALPEATTIGSADIFILNQSGTTKKLPYSVFKYDSDDAGTQINDSLAILRPNISQEISDSLAASGTSITVGSQYQIPYSNAGGDDFVYSSLFTWNGTTLGIQTSTGNNTFLGTSAGNSSTGSQNTFIGYLSGYSSTTGNYNTFLGHESGRRNTTGNYNTQIGHGAGYFGVTGGQNTMLGYRAGYANTTSYNTFIGYEAGRYTTSGNLNVFIGANAGYGNTTGIKNTFIGYQTGNATNTGDENTFVGYRSGTFNTSGEYNLFSGTEAGYSNTTGNYNTYNGYKSGRTNTTGYENVFLGANAGYTNATGFRNVYLGNYAGYSATGTGNVFIGYQAGQNETGDSLLYIANSNDATPLIWGDFANDTVRINGYLDINGGTSITGTPAGSNNEIQYNNGGTFGSSSNFAWNDTAILVSFNTSNVLINPDGFSSIIGGALNAEENTIIGSEAGRNITDGSSNIIIGSLSGGSLTEGSTNTIIGTQAGLGITTGDGNVFLGYQSGYNETGSNKLYIENSNSSTPLIYGEFDNDIIKLADTLEITPDTTFVRNKLKITNGAIYVDGRVITPARASAYIATGDEAATTISVADTYYFLKGTFTNLDTCDFQFSGDTLQYIGEETVNLTLHYSCTFGVGQVNTKVTTGVTVNDVVLPQSEMERTIAGTSDRGSWSGVASMELDTNDKIKLEVQADKTGTVTAYRFSTVLQ
jgi:hypothetical protein